MSGFARYGLSGLAEQIELRERFSAEIAAPTRRVRAQPQLRRRRPEAEMTTGFRFCPYCQKPFSAAPRSSAGVFQCPNCGQLLPCEDY